MNRFSSALLRAIAVAFPLFVLSASFAVRSASAENLIANGTFDHKEDPLLGWLTDYAWTKNSYYIDNSKLVSVVQEGGMRGGVAHLKVTGDHGTKMETVPIPFEPGYRYSCTMDVKGGGGHRIYFAGYKWKPGIRPHENPEPGELRMIYKSKAAETVGGSWKRIEIELPGVKLSPTAKQSLKPVRFISVYIWMMKDGFVDNVVVEKRPDPDMEL